MINGTTIIDKTEFLTGKGNFFLVNPFMVNFFTKEN